MAKTVRRKMATKVEEQTDREYMTVTEVAEMLGVSLGTVRNWIRAGEVTSFKIGSG